MVVVEVEEMFRDAGNVGGDIQTGPSFQRVFVITDDNIPVIELTFYTYDAEENAVCRHCDGQIVNDDNGAGGRVWCHDFGSTVCYDNPPGSHEDGDTTTVAEPVDSHRAFVQTAVHLVTFDDKGREVNPDVRYWDGSWDGETAEARCQSISREDIDAALDQMGF